MHIGYEELWSKKDQEYALSPRFLEKSHHDRESGNSLARHHAEHPLIQGVEMAVTATQSQLMLVLNLVMFSSLTAYIHAQNCSAQATWIETAADHCMCNVGFAMSCPDVDECLDWPCKNDTLCTNTFGSFTCDPVCMPGFETNDGSTCTQCPEGKYKDTAGTHQCRNCRDCSVGEVLSGCGPQSPGECSCAEDWCCPQTLGDSASLEPHLDAIYGDRLVKLDVVASTLPSYKINCDEIDWYKEGAHDLMASSSKLYDTCLERCEEKDVGILSGTGYAGLNLPHAMDVCFSSTDPMTREHEELCERYDETMCTLEHSTADVVCAFEQVNYEALVKQSNTKKQAKLARMETLDIKNQEKIQDVTDAEVPGTILEIYSDILSRYSASNDELSSSLKHLSAEFDTLHQDFDHLFPDIEESLLICPTMTLRTDPDNHILHDICSQQSSECIEDPDAEHVSCCCVYNPLAQMPGLSLRTAADPEHCDFFDICSESRKNMKSYIKGTDLANRMEREDYLKFAAALNAQYGESFREHDISFPPQDPPAPPPGPWSPKDPTNCTSSVNLRDVEAGVPLEMVDVFEGPYGELDLVYDFDGTVEDSWCSRRFESEEDPYDRCSAFCGESSVPLMVGWPTSGVNVNQALSVCFDSEVVGNAEDREFCTGDGREALQRLRSALVDLVCNLQVFQILRATFADVMHGLNDIIREEADSPKLQDEVQRQNSEQGRKDAYIDFYQERFEHINASATILRIQSLRVRESFARLESEFNTSLPQLERYSQNCSQGFPRSKDNHALLAVCPVSGTVCADDTQASFVYCCCSENVFLPTEDPEDICSAAKNCSAELLQNYSITNPTSSSRRHSDLTYLAKYQQGLMERYGDDLDTPVLRVASSATSDNEDDGGSVPECPEQIQTSCHGEASCARVNNTFACVCNAGYHGDGVTCFDIDECGTDVCSNHAHCINVLGSFTCVCSLGYDGDGVSCTDHDECSARTNNCDKNAACFNVPGSFMCACMDGYTTRDGGTTCTSEALGSNDGSGVVAPPSSGGKVSIVVFAGSIAGVLLIAGVASFCWARKKSRINSEEKQKATHKKGAAGPRKPKVEDVRHGPEVPPPPAGSALYSVANTRDSVRGFNADDDEESIFHSPRAQTSVQLPGTTAELPIQPARESVWRKQWATRVQRPSTGESM